MANNIDFEKYLATRNPYTKGATVGGQRVTVAPTYSDLLAANQWNLQQRAQQQAVENAGNAFLANAVWNPTGVNKTGFQSIPWGSMGAVGSAPQAAAPDWTAAARPQAGVTPPTAAGPFSVISLTKDPEIEGDINAVLGRVREGNMSALTRQPRSERLNAMTGAMYEKLRGDINNTEQSIADFNKEFLSIRPEDRAALEQENQVLGNFFGGPEDPNSLIARLNQQAQQRAFGMSGVTNQALAQLGRANKDVQMRAGQSGYLDKLATNAAQNLLAQEQIAQADLARQNLLDVSGYQAGLAGRRGDLLDAYLRRGLAPLQARQAASAADLAALGQLGNIDLANLYTTTQGQDLAQQLGLLGGLSNLRQANRYTGLQKAVTDQGAGLLPIPGLAGVPSYPTMPQPDYGIPYDPYGEYNPFGWYQPQQPQQAAPVTPMGKNIPLDQWNYLSSPEGQQDWFDAYGWSFAPEVQEPAAYGPQPQTPFYEWPFAHQEQNSFFNVPVDYPGQLPGINPQFKVPISYLGQPPLELSPLTQSGNASANYWPMPGQYVPRLSQ